MTSDPTGDQGGIQDLREGREGALESLMSRWERPLFAFAWRYLRNATDASNLVAETFVRLHEQREHLRADTRLSAWLFTTLANLCHSQFRWQRRHPAISLDAPAAGGESVLAESIPCEADAPDAAAENAELNAYLRQAIDQLPHKLKVTLLLHHYERLSYREIAAIVGCSERGVETRLFRSRHLLRKALQPFLRESSPFGLRPECSAPGEP
ncbi:MAG TPA: RNA polymerase sigma factor [Opitutaceae bacterium]|jgi:RNA polymerase sigma-70 factor (ECF subfamily)